MKFILIENLQYTSIHEFYLTVTYFDKSIYDMIKVD